MRHQDMGFAAVTDLGVQQRAASDVQPRVNCLHVGYSRVSPGVIRLQQLCMLLVCQQLITCPYQQRAACYTAAMAIRRLCA